MTDVKHFVERNIILPESTDADFKALNVEDATSLDKNLTLPPLPSSFSIRNEMTAVKDQGRQGSCTSFCVAACLEHVQRQIVSEGGMQHEAEKTHGDCQEGLAMVHSFAISRSNGAVLDSVWPYDDSQVCWATPPNTAGQARYKFNGYGYVYNRSRLQLVENFRDISILTPGLPLTLRIQRQLFARRRPIAISVPVVWSAWPWDGNVIMPSTSMWDEFYDMFSLPNVDGWHCIAITGWDNSTGRFTFKNSWGTFWGDNGYGTIPFQYVDNYSDTGIVGW